MKKAARQLSEDAAGDWLFLLPNLIVADKGITGPAEERDHRVVRPVQRSRRDEPRRRVAAGRRARRVGDVILRVLQRLGILVVSLLVSSVLVFAFMAVLPGDPARVALGRQRVRRGGGRSCVEQFGLDRPLVDAVPRLARRAAARSTSATSYVSRRGDRSAGRRPAPGDPVAGRGRHGHRAADRGPRWACSMAVRHRKPSGLRLSAVSQVGVAVPAFLAGILLITVFAVQLGWLPANGWTPPVAGPGDVRQAADPARLCRSGWSRARC